MRAVSAIALALGAAALVLPLAGFVPDAVEPADRAGVVPSPVAPAPITQPAPPALAAEARLQVAREELAAARQDPATFARALRELEAALHGLRAGVGEAEDEARAMRYAIRMQDAEVKRLLASLVSASLARAERVPPIHPGGPVAAARAAALMPPSDAELRKGAAAIGTRMAALADAERLRDTGKAALAEGLAAAGDARATLRRTALARAGAVPPGPPEQGSALATVARESDTLGDLAGRLAGPVPPEVEQAAEFALVAAADLAPGDARITRSSRNLPDAETELFLEMPVTGRVLRGFKAADAAGVLRPGLMLAAAPQAIVTAPAAGEIRYVGPFLEWNRVVALAPADGTIVLLAGLAEVAVRPGEIVSAGAPIGFLGGAEIGAQDFLMLPDKGNDALGAETLYMEVWRAGEPVDPVPWLGIRTDAQNG